MDRLLYLLSLLILQAALIGDVTPGVAEFIRATAALNRSPDPAATLLRLAVASAAVLGAAPVLGAPVLMLLRHHQRGGLRFLGLPRWGCRLAIGGAAVYLAIRVAELLPLAIAIPTGLAGLAGEFASGTARSAVIALMCGSTLAAELLRRSVAPPRQLSEVMPIRYVQVEVVHPDALRGHIAAG